MRVQTYTREPDATWLIGLVQTGKSHWIGTHTSRVALS